MRLRQVLEEKRPLILEKWFQKVMEEYPSEGRKFLSNIKRDRFDNPAGFTILEVLEGLFDYLLYKEDSLNKKLDTFIRLRAVQDFKPSEAVQFIFYLKDIIFKEIPEVHAIENFVEEFRVLSSEIDGLAFRVFDAYMMARERLNEVKINEFRNMTSWILKKVNILKEYPEEIQ